MPERPKTVGDDEHVLAVYNTIPKRILWDALWDAASRLCPVGQESIDQATADPNGRGSIVEWIVGEAIVRNCWFPKALLVRPEAPAAEPEAEPAPAVEQPAPAEKKPSKRASRKARAVAAATGS